MRSLFWESLPCSSNMAMFFFLFTIVVDICFWEACFHYMSIDRMSHLIFRTIALFFFGGLWGRGEKREA